MRRREFITLVGGAVAGRPLTAHAQQKRVHQIGVLTPFSENDPGEGFKTEKAGLEDVYFSNIS